MNVVQDEMVFPDCTCHANYIVRIGSTINARGTRIILCHYNSKYELSRFEYYISKKNLGGI
jgi:hypothetical protein